MMNAEIGVMQLQAKECERWWKLPEARNKQGRILAYKLQTSSRQNCETINFCYCKPPSLWYFVTAALEN